MHVAPTVPGPAVVRHVDGPLRCTAATASSLTRLGVRTDCAAIVAGVEFEAVGASPPSGRVDNRSPACLRGIVSQQESSSKDFVYAYPGTLPGDLINCAGPKSG